VAINEVILAALDITAYAVRTAGIEVRLDLAEEIPTLHADADQLHQVFLNLIINAQQAQMDQTEPRRLILSSRFEAKPQRIHLSVADNGPGVPPDLRGRLFEPYFTTKPIGVGTGVGLAVSLGIIEAHGGNIEVECPPERGTTFHIVLPIGAVAEAGAGPTTRTDDKQGPLTVLVVDDEPSIRETLAEILDGAGHRVNTAASGEEALRMLERQSYDAILTDIRMPDLDGRGLSLEIERRWPEHAHRIVFVTGDTLGQSRLGAGSDSRPVLEKPFLPADVLRVLSEVVQARI
jgi:two-component system NtrC family sensor kinase